MGHCRPIIRVPCGQVRTAERQGGTTALPEEKIPAIDIAIDVEVAEQALRSGLREALDESRQVYGVCSRETCKKHVGGCQQAEVMCKARLIRNLHKPRTIVRHDQGCTQIISRKRRDLFGDESHPLPGSESHSTEVE